VSAPSIEILETAPSDLREIETLLAAARRADDHQPLGEQKRLELHGKGPFLALLLRRTDARGRPMLAGLAQLDVASDSVGLEVVVDPSQRAASGDDDARATLVTAARAEVARRGGGLLRYWVAQATEADDDAASALGFSCERSLLQLRIDLAGRVRAALPLEFAMRPFRRGRDEAAWLLVNGRAFADHPEQGRWDEASLAARESEPWFDPDGFLLAEEDGRLAGSCWTKLHHDTDPLVGEIYVISVDPDFQKRGLGQGLTSAGLDWMAGAGARTGMLYVDDANVGALALYRSLGFAVDHADRCYIAQIPRA
jgi:mycothiol synthase